MRIAIIGFGIVGESFAKILSEKRRELVKSYGLRADVVAVVDVKGAVVDPSGVNFDELYKSRRARGTIELHPKFKPDVGGVEVIEKVDADVVVEVTPTNIVDGEPGLSHIMAALKRKRHVITSNKGPLALALPALTELAAYNRVLLRFSGAVGGGTPVLDLGRKCLVGDRIVSLRGILNGTTNYILSRMDEAEVSVEAALGEARQKGYAEADPSYDLKGIDSACKLVITANWVLGRSVTLHDVDITGITDVTLDDVRRAKAEDCAVKLIASAKEDELVVRPELVSRKHPLCVNGALNAVSFMAEYAGEVTVIGKGAGGTETGGAILRDLIDIRRGIPVLEEEKRF